MTLIDHYEGSATIVQDAKRIAATIAYRVERADIDISTALGSTVTTRGLTEWNGRFIALDGALDLGQAATVELPDGRTGRIIITSVDTIDVTELGDTARQSIRGHNGEFVGNGVAP